MLPTYPLYNVISSHYVYVIIMFQNIIIAGYLLEYAMYIHNRLTSAKNYYCAACESLVHVKEAKIQPNKDNQLKIVY